MIRVVETATKFYFVMELAQSDLNSYSNGINMREEEIRHILKPIFECLKYAHSQDITHRDIKVCIRKKRARVIACSSKYYWLVLPSDLTPCCIPPI